MKLSNHRLWLFRVVGIFCIGATILTFRYVLLLYSEQTLWTVTDAARTDIYSLTGTWTDQDNQKVQLSDFRGLVIMVGFVYPDCPAVCPRIISDMKQIAEQVRNKTPKDDFESNVRILLFLFEDRRKETNSLRTFLEKYKIRDKNWRVLTADSNTFNKLADVFKLEYSVVDKKYKSYLHSNLIALIGRDGKALRTRFGFETSIKGMTEALSDAIMNR